MSQAGPSGSQAHKDAFWAFDTSPFRTSSATPSSADGHHLLLPPSPTSPRTSPVPALAWRVR